MTCINKIVVFDLDETLGYFIELGMFWDALIAYIKYIKMPIKINQELFNKLLDLYPEFLRPNILVILNYLKKKKMKKHCNKLMIYTNNQGPEEWAKYIINYFDDKVNYKLFDQIIAAFKVNGKQVELCRTTHMKTLKDLVSCTKVPENTQICFLDDVFYPGMSNDNIYYINIKPYVHDIKFDEMITRLLKSEILDIKPIDTDSDLCREYIKTYLTRFNYTHVDKHIDSQHIDKILSKKILNHLHIFFNKKSIISPKTKKRRVFTNKTLKKKAV